MTDRQQLTWQQTFFKRVTRLSTAPARSSRSWVNQWSWERSTDRVVTDLRVMQMQVWGPGVAGGLLGENFSGLWEVAVVEKVGLTTCERDDEDRRVRLVIRGSAQNNSLRTDPYGRWRWRWRSRKWKGRWERLWRVQRGESKKNQTHKRMTRGWYDAHHTLSQCHVRHC